MRILEIIALIYIIIALITSFLTYITRDKKWKRKTEIIS